MPPIKHAKNNRKLITRHLSHITNHAHEKKAYHWHWTMLSEIIRGNYYELRFQFQLHNIISLTSIHNTHDSSKETKRRRCELQFHLPCLREREKKCSSTKAPSNNLLVWRNEVSDAETCLTYIIEQRRRRRRSSPREWEKKFVKEKVPSVRFGYTNYPSDSDNNDWSC